MTYWAGPKTVGQTNNSDVYWEANGLSLHTMAWSVKSFGGKRFFSAPMRGDDLLLPFRTGRVHVPKIREAHSFDMQLWVLPVNTDGSKDRLLTPAQKIHQNWRTIIAYTDVEAPFPLVKRWYDGSQVRSATATAELANGEDPTTADGKNYYGSLQLLLADPYFYGPQRSVAAGAINVEGDVATPHVVIEMGPGRMTFPNGNWVEYNGTGTVTIDCMTGNARSGGTFVNGLIERNRFYPEWPVLPPGQNEIVGTGTIKYEPAYR